MQNKGHFINNSVHHIIWLSFILKKLLFKEFAHSKKKMPV